MSDAGRVAREVYPTTGEVAAEVYPTPTEVEQEVYSRKRRPPRKAEIAAARALRKR